MLLYSILQSLDIAAYITNIIFAMKFFDKKNYDEGTLTLRLGRKKRVGFKNKSQFNSIESKTDESFNVFDQLVEEEFAIHSNLWYTGHFLGQI